MCTAYFHEDDYCQLEVLPLTAKAYCLKEMGQIEAFVGKLQDEGAGFSDIYLRGDSPHSMEELSLRSQQLDEALSFLPSYDRVETGYSSYREELKSTYGRGAGPEQNVFWSVEKVGLVNALWLDLWISPEIKELWQRTLTALGQLAPVLLADWGWERCVDLTSPQEIQQYVTDKVNNTLRLLEERKKYLENSK